MALKAARALPHDYTFLWEKYDEICPASKAKELQAQGGEIEQTMKRITSGKGSMFDKVKIVSYTSSLLPCATNFLRPDHIHAAEYDLYMSTAFAHATTEWPAQVHVPIFGARDWQKYDSALIAETKEHGHGDGDGGGDGDGDGS